MNSQYLNQQPQKTLIMPTLESVSQKMKMYVSMADTASLISDESLKRLEINELFDEIGSQMPPAGPNDDYVYRDVGVGGVRKRQFTYEAKDQVCHVELLAQIGEVITAIQIRVANFGPKDPLTRRGPLITI